jgi:hypothetical protein
LGDHEWMATALNTRNETEQLNAQEKEQELMSRHPDLKRTRSPFFKATPLLYGTMVKAGAPSHEALDLAAQKAEEQFRADLTEG